MWFIAKDWLLSILILNFVIVDLLHPKVYNFRFKRGDRYEVNNKSNWEYYDWE